MYRLTNINKTSDKRAKNFLIICSLFSFIRDSWLTRSSSIRFNKCLFGKENIFFYIKSKAGVK